MAIFADDAVSGFEINCVALFIYLNCIAQANVGAGATKDTSFCVDFDYWCGVVAAHFVSFLFVEGLTEAVFEGAFS